MYNSLGLGDSQDTYVYSFLQGGKPRELSFGDLQAAVDQACLHLEGEEAMIFQIRRGEEVLFSGIEIIELYPAWVDWRAGNAEHPIHALDP